MFCASFKLVKLDILDSNVHKNVFIHITDRNVDLKANVSEKNVIICLAVSDLLKVFTFSYVIISCVKSSFNTFLCLEYMFCSNCLIKFIFLSSNKIFLLQIINIFRFMRYKNNLTFDLKIKKIDIIFDFWILLKCIFCRKTSLQKQKKLPLLPP